MPSLNMGNPPTSGNSCQAPPHLNQGCRVRPMAQVKRGYENTSGFWDEKATVTSVCSSLVGFLYQVGSGKCELVFGGGVEPLLLGDSLF